MRPDALIQGAGCIAMGGTVFLLKFFDFDHVLLDVSDGAGMESLPMHVLAWASLCLAPCCLGCGALMVWHGLGFSFGSWGLSTLVRCDLPERKANESDDEEERAK